MKTLHKLAAALWLTGSVFASVIPNPRISVGQPIEANPSWSANVLNDGLFGTAWYYSAGNWVAMKLEGQSPSRILLTWNTSGGNWSDQIPSAGSCNSSMTFPSSYNILTSANSTDGDDGSWDTVLQVSDNVVGGRAHLLDFTGASWVKMDIVKGSGNLDEIEVFDASHGIEDSWFFMGTSITMMTYKSTVPDSSYADLVTGRLATQSPALIRGGVGCINSTHVIHSISDYLDYMEGIHYVAIEMGTNDAWGGSDWNLATYASNMQAMIDSIRGRGLEPVLARPPATDSSRAGWQMDVAYPQTVDSLVQYNHLIAGPDLYSWFLAHPEELNDDGVHPSAVGAQSILRLWADAMMDNLYSVANTSIQARSASTLPKAIQSSQWDGLGRRRNRSSAILLTSQGAQPLLR